MSRHLPPPRDPSYLEILASRLPDSSNIPNFEKVGNILFDTFVRPDGPALLLVSHYYYTGRGFSKEEPSHDPMDQVRWCRQHLSYFSQLAKFIARLRNKLAHKQHIDPDLLKSLARELSNLEAKGTNAGYLLTSTISKLRKVLEVCVNEDPKKLECETCGRPYVEEKPKPLIPQEGSLVDLELLTLKDVKNEPTLRDSIKGKTVMIVGGKWNGKMAVFRSWTGTVAYMEIQEVGRKKVRNETVIKLLE